MDPNSLNTLDPKLKETYDRVMGTTTNPPPATPTPLTANPSVAPLNQTTIPTPPPLQTSTPLTNPNPLPDNSVKGPLISPDMQQSQTAAPQTAPYTQDNLSFQAAIQTPMVNTAGQTSVGVVGPQQSSSLLRILYIFAAVVFFVVYTFVWIKIFNLPLPF